MGDKNFRLTRDPRPLRYTLTLSPDIDAHTFNGRGTIELQVDAPLRAFALHGSRITVHAARARAVNSGVWLAARWVEDGDSQTIAFALDGELPAGRALLELEWSGHFQSDLRGLYLAGGIAVTQLEAADARRVFPCFDEPAFKAVWDISVIAPEGVAVIGNGRVLADARVADGKRTVRLAPTPVMSSYLVAVCVGKLVASEEVTVRGVPIRTFATPDKAHLTDFAQECAAAVLPLLEDYFGTPYAFGKLDQLGIPDFEAGAMENSGCITFREVLLLIDVERAPLSLKKRAAEVITHELAHQWFGNLVTMQWWDDLWLNEAFATWMAFKIVDVWRPGWRMWDDFDQGKAAALHLDAMESTHAIHAEVKNAEAATENFDLITYEKGGAMLRMIEGYLGASKFMEGIRGYMKRHAYANAVADDLWAALARTSGEPIQEVANAWIHEAGFPLVDLARDESRGSTSVRLSQRRFFADPARFAAAPPAAPTDGAVRWPVPIVLRWRDDEGAHESRLLLRASEATLDLPAQGAVQFIYGNRGGAGFYRVRYAAEEIARLAAHWRDLAPVERMNLVSDAWAVFRAGATPLEPVLELMLGLAGDSDYAVLGEVVSRLDGIERRLLDAAARPRFRELVARSFSERLAQLGLAPAESEGDERRLERAQVVRALALVARDGALVERLRRWLLASDSPTGTPAFDPNLIDTVYVAVARGGDAAHFERLIARLNRESDPAARRRYLVALASFEEPALVDRALALIPTDVVPMQDIATFVSTLLGSPATQDRAFDHLRAGWPALMAKAAAPMLLRRIVESLGELAHRRADVEALFDAQAPALGPVQQAVRQTRERLRLDEELRKRALPVLTRWLQNLPPSIR